MHLCHGVCCTNEHGSAGFSFSWKIGEDDDDSAQWRTMNWHPFLMSVAFGTLFTMCMLARRAMVKCSRACCFETRTCQPRMRISSYVGPVAAANHGTAACAYKVMPGMTHTQQKIVHGVLNFLALVAASVYVPEGLKVTGNSGTAREVGAAYVQLLTDVVSVQFL